MCSTFKSMKRCPEMSPFIVGKLWRLGSYGITAESPGDARTMVVRLRGQGVEPVYCYGCCRVQKWRSGCIQVNGARMVSTITLDADKDL